jgi:NADPH:quinone reductase-like Zn-dependent oxidoreductase
MGPLARQRIRQLTDKVNHDDLVVLKDLIEAGKIRPVIDTTFPLTEVPKAILRWKDGNSHGKIAITI